MFSTFTDVVVGIYMFFLSENRKLVGLMCDWSDIYNVKHIETLMVPKPKTETNLFFNTPP